MVVLVVTVQVHQFVRARLVFKEPYAPTLRIFVFQRLVSMEVFAQTILPILQADSIAIVLRFLLDPLVPTVPLALYKVCSRQQ
jgi:hypothetical protein